jgi:hypothetical protein
MSPALRQLRAVLVALHVVAVVSMSVPSPENISVASLTKRHAREFRPWQDAFAKIGVPPETTLDVVVRGGRVLETVEGGAERVFAPYERLLGVHQNWRMFAQSAPQGEIVEMLVYQGSTWRRVYAVTAPDARWHADIWEQGRVRGVMDVIGRQPENEAWGRVAQSAARRAAVDFPDATVFRMQVVPTRSPPPEALAGGLQRGAARAVTDIDLAALREAR